MERKSVEKQFLKFVLPSMLTMLLSGFYTIVDGFFVGRAIGDIGLAGINISWPIAAFIIATGMGIGTGGAVLMSVYRGEENFKDLQSVRANTLTLLAVSSILITIVFGFTYPQILKLLGASGNILNTASEYTKIIIIGSVFQIFGAGLTPVLRNNHKTIQAMSIMIGGLIVNIILDAWFIMGLGLGLTGAALATIIAQAFTALFSIIFIFSEKDDGIKLSHFKPNLYIIKKILAIGTSPFGLSLMPSIIIVLNNWQCLRYGGESAVAAYAVISYIVGSVLLLLSGVGEGIQPLISFCIGAKEYQSMKIIMRKAVIMVLIVSSTLFLFMMSAKNILPELFGTSEETAEIIKSALLIFGISFPLMGIVKLFSSYFYASESTWFSTILIYLDPILITPLLLFVLPTIFELNGIWIAMPASQGILAILSILMHKIHHRQLSNSEGKLAIE